MKKITTPFFAVSLLATSLLAHSQPDNWPPFTPLDKVEFQVSAKEWVTTQSALLTVNVNATLTGADLVKARSDIMSKLAKIAPGDWHLTQFDRSQDTSGLEKLFVVAQVRVPQTNLTDIYQHAKDISQPGATYTINGVDFKPGLEEIQKVKATLRERLYQQVNDEIGRLNKVYGNQHYSLNQLYILDGQDEVMPKIYHARAQPTGMIMAAAPGAAPALTVGNELVMSAVVELASNRAGSDTGAHN